MIKSYFCEVLASTQRIEDVVNSITSQNPEKHKFYLTGECKLTDNKIIPLMSIFEEKFIGDDAEFLCYIYEEINRYVSSVQEMPQFIKRVRPWIKPYPEFSFSVYDSFRIDPNLLQALSGSQLTYSGVKIATVSVPWPSSFLIPKELYILLTYSHQSLIHCFGITSYENQHHLILKHHKMTLCLKIASKNLSKPEKLSILKQLLSSLWFLHSKKIVGVGWSPEKILIANNREVKILDFSEADVLETEEFGCDEENREMNTEFIRRAREDVLVMNETFRLILSGGKEDGMEEIIQLIDSMNSIVSDCDHGRIYTLLKAYI